MVNGGVGRVTLGLLLGAVIAFVGGAFDLSFGPAAVWVGLALGCLLGGYVSGWGIGLGLVLGSVQAIMVGAILAAVGLAATGSMGNPFWPEVARGLLLNIALAAGCGYVGQLLGVCRDNEMDLA